MMRKLRLLFARLAGIRPSGNRDQSRELHDELESHLQFHIDDNIRRGMSPDQARREAIMKLGGIEPVKEAYRDAGSVPFIEHLLQDIKFSIRQLRKNSGFTSTAILMLAVGMCASIAIFAFVDAALIKPLPYKDPSRLMGVFETSQTVKQSNLSFDDYLDWKRMNNVFASFDIYNRQGYSMSTPTGPQPVPIARVTDGFFRTLGVSPAQGRDFYAGEDQPNAPLTVLISHAAWLKRFGGGDKVLGQTVLLNKDPYVIVGVLPKEFHFAPAEPVEFWTPFHPVNNCDKRRGCHGLYGVGRLKEDVSKDTALANLTAIAQQLEKQYPDSNRGQGANVVPLDEVIVGNVRPILLLLLAGAALLLLIASVNVAGLLLVRSETRKREIAVRTALGASSTRMFSQFVTEGFVLVTAGSLLGLAAAAWTMQALTKLIPVAMLARMSFLNDLALNPRVLAFAAAISLLAVIFFSLTPAVRLSSPDVRSGLAEGSRGSAGTVWNRLGGKLVVLELAVAVVLLVSAGLLGRSLYQLLHVDLGFRADHLITVNAFAPNSTYGKPEQAIALGRQLMNKLAELPGVASVGFSASGLPLDGNGNTSWLRILGRPWNGEHNDTPSRTVSVNYFTALGATLLRGRYFDESEDASKPAVTIINRAFAEKNFPGEDPIGKQISYLSTPPKPIEIVGVIENLREGPLDADIPPVIYRPYNQNAFPFYGLVVRTTHSESQILTSINATFRSIDPEIVTIQGIAMETKINDSQSAYLHRSTAWLVGAFAALALLLGVVGLYGVIAYSVGQRTREIGVRMALGAKPSSVYQMILSEAGWLAATGIGIGLLCSIGTTRLMSSLLFNVSSWDLPTLAVVAIVLGLAAMLASFIPARRAASVNPIEALRAE